MKVSIEGNIGCGKTTLLCGLDLALQDCNGTYVYQEPLEEWKDALTMYYADPKRWSFLNNTNVLLSYSAIKASIDNDDPKFRMLITERSPHTCKRVFTELARDLGNMTDLEMNVFDKVFEQIAWAPDAVIYLRMSPTLCAERIKLRGRGFEAEMSPDYLVGLHEKHEKLMEEFGCLKRRVFVVDAEKTKEELLDEVMAIIKGLMPA
jgi:deoxyadenosine/deoxycytidine kinase